MECKGCVIAAFLETAIADHLGVHPAFDVLEHEQ
jgi:hypothetical protein